MQGHTPPLARLLADQPPPRIDGSIHVEKYCYECGASSLTVLLDPIIRANVHTGGVEYRYACRELTECAFRKAGLTS